MIELVYIFKFSKVCNLIVAFIYRPIFKLKSIFLNMLNFLLNRINVTKLRGRIKQCFIVHLVV